VLATLRTGYEILVSAIKVFLLDIDLGFFYVNIPWFDIMKNMECASQYLSTVEFCLDEQLVYGARTDFTNLSMYTREDWP